MRLTIATLAFIFITLIADAQKINGVSLVGHPTAVEKDCFESIQKVNANFVTLMPYAYTDEDSDRLKYNVDRQWWGEKIEGVEICIKMAKAHQLEVMIKPHVWIRQGAYTGTFELESEDQWQNWEKDYTGYILQYALLSEKYQLPIFCIGTELDRSAQLRKSFWIDLIDKVRHVYSGKLVYAANWDSYEKIPFWNELDYVGVDAYFPLSESETPQIKELMRAWIPTMNKLEKFSLDNSKAIMFTEFGYRSINYTAQEPWRSDRNLELNLTAQANALEALFKIFWDREWFAGGFLWKWHADKSLIRADNNRFTPQNKPAEKVVAQWYARFYH